MTPDPKQPEQPSVSPTGKSIIPASLTPYIFLGFLVSGAITTVAMSEPSMPHWLTIVGAVGSLVFGGALGMGPGWRKGRP